MTAIYGWDTKRDAVCDILADLHLAVRDLVLLKRTEDIRTVFFTDRDAAADLADRFTSRALIRLRYPTLEGEPPAPSGIGKENEYG